MLLRDNRRRAARQRDTGKYTILFFFSVSLTMVVLSLYGAQASVFQKARATVLDFFEPVLTVFAVPSQWVTGRVESVNGFFAMREELDDLRAENERLRSIEAEAQEAARQLAYYAEITTTRLPPRQIDVSAQVIGEAAGPFNKALLLSVGGEDGIKEGSAVMDGRGLLGHVSLVAGSASRVLPLTNVGSRVPVIVEPVNGSSDRTFEALLSGQTDSPPALDVFSQRIDQLPPDGSRVITSGAGGLMPRGLPVGETVVSRQGDVLVRLYANHRAPNMVRVLTFDYPDRDEVTRGEN